MAAPAISSPSCVFCQIARSSTSTTLLHSDEKVVAFQDIKPAAFRHYLVIPVEHIPTVKDLKRRGQDFSLDSVAERCTRVSTAQMGGFIESGVRKYGTVACDYTGNVRTCNFVGNCRRCSRLIK